METQEESTTMKAAEPQKEHEWLQKLVGEWTMEDEPGAEPSPSNGQWTETMRSIGGLWIVGESRGGMPGGGDPATMIITLGYDPQKQRFVGTFIGSMMTNMWVYEGTLDGNVLTLDTEGPSMDKENAGKIVKYQDRIELKSDDHRVLTSQLRGEDGEWKVFMTAHYRRKK
jgi:hypothetical protein